MKKSGREGKYSAAAKNWLNSGTEVNTPEFGDIVTIRTTAAEEAENKVKAEGKVVPDPIARTGYHVGFYISGGAGSAASASSAEIKARACVNRITPFGPHHQRLPPPQGARQHGAPQNRQRQGRCALKGYEGCLPLATFTTGLERVAWMETGVAGRGPSVPHFETVSITRVGDGSAVSLLGLMLDLQPVSQTGAIHPD